MSEGAEEPGTGGGWLAPMEGWRSHTQRRGRKPSREWRCALSAAANPSAWARKPRPRRTRTPGIRLLLFPRHSSHHPSPHPSCAAVTPPPPHTHTLPGAQVIEYATKPDYSPGAWYSVLGHVVLKVLYFGVGECTRVTRP